MGNGMYTNSELTDSLINDLNSLIKNIASGQYVQFCMIVTQMTQKLVNLKSGIESDIANKNKIIENLKQQLRDEGAEVEEMTPDEFLKKIKDGVEDAK